MKGERIMLPNRDFERLMDYQKWLKVATDAEDIAWYEGEIAKLSEELNGKQRNLIKRVESGKPVNGLVDKDKRVCEVCDKWYWPRAADQRFCGAACRAEGQRRDYHARVAAVVAGDIVPTALGSRVMCEPCGQLFEMVHSNQKYCSRECANRAHGKRQLEYYRARRAKSLAVKINVVNNGQQQHGNK